MRSWRNAALAVVLAFGAVLGASQVSAVTDWKTKATVSSKTIVLDAVVAAWVDVAKPYSLRVRLRSPGHAQTVTTNYSTFCVTASNEGTREGEFSMALSGTTSWTVHAIPKPTGTWTECSVYLYVFSNATGRMEMQIQAKMR
ncbi:MAG TPA: hypothetical protein VF071_03225 [Candidatus Limnocylindria bacterium]